jgi:23S rRNA (cytosine1962-C5)-methyltransferase
MQLITDFNDYKILDMKEGQKLERWGDYILSRPDPQIIWCNKENSLLWDKAHAVYTRSSDGGGKWKINQKMPEVWQIKYDEMIFNLKLMNFKHTGIFPEQAFNWRLIKEKIKSANRKVKVLNLFAYTGAASVAALSAGALVTHVDSSKGMVEWAKENVKSSGLEDKSIRYLVDDVTKFVKREIRRESKYDIIIMDPPSFGRGSSGEIWDIEKDLFNLVELSTELLSNNPLLFIINSYTTGLSSTILVNILELTINSKYKGKITGDELGILMENSNLVLPCGITARWELP